MRPFATLLALSLGLLLPVPADAQVVGSIEFAEARTMDGLYVDADGGLFATSGFLGTDIYRISPSGGASVFATGIRGPIHLVEAPDGNYYATNFASGVVSRIAPDGTVSAFAAVDEGPSDIVAGADGALYVTQYGNPAGAGDGDSVTRIAPDGTVSTFAEGGFLSAPVGVDFDDEGNLFTANIVDGRIVKIAPDGSQELFARLDPVPGQFLTVGHVVWSEGRLYATYLSGNQVVAFDRDGTATVVAGTGEAGRDDGPADAASFTSPNGIAVSPDGATLYVSEYIGPNRRIRTITRLATSSADGPGAAPFGVTVGPNPAAGRSTVRFALEAPSPVSVTVFDSAGREVRRVDAGARGVGAHEVAWETAGLPAGLYLVRVEAGALRAVRSVAVVGR